MRFLFLTAVLISALSAQTPAQSITNPTAIASASGAISVMPIDSPLAAKLKAAEQDARLAKLESLVLREQIAQQQLKEIRAEQQALYAETCKAADLTLEACQIDLNQHAVTAKPPAAKPAK